ncbi:uncharacterized protein (TIGR02611 family) [Kineococcus xinjiangensis]|uniref:Uncharacterized protein (TIGR02611 family) n=1 Tax=Kineococcus xinjiangensis TaxID=512762 RepID=A0A2S6IP87_9ACTN|nr:TIGR02611 family protein [Kineococcus xinjiangensis]PPK95950.1 uncharacterized protein (TIGR02611 family) [Kineococcus xinjiangensis]
MDHAGGTSAPRRCAEAAGTGGVVPAPEVPPLAPQGGAAGPAAERPAPRSAPQRAVARVAPRPRRWRAALHARREQIRADARMNHLWRVAVALIGTCITALGLVLVPLPGPGWLVVLIGLAVLGSEFHWARRTHLWVRRHVHAWASWVAERSWSIRIALGATTATLLLSLAWGWLAWQGVPTWVPEDVSASLVLLPGLD